MRFGTVFVLPSFLKTLIIDLIVDGFTFISRESYLKKIESEFEY